MDVEAFIRRWSNLEGGAERANYDCKHRGPTAHKIPRG